MALIALFPRPTQTREMAIQGQDQPHTPSGRCNPGKRQTTISSNEQAKIENNQYHVFLQPAWRKTLSSHHILKGSILRNATKAQTQSKLWSRRTRNDSRQPVCRNFPGDPGTISAQRSKKSCK